MPKKKQSLYMKMHNGRMIDIRNPTFEIKEIAFGLSKVPRFVGQTHMEYSVANHSTLVARLCRQMGGNPKEGLMHDSTEFLGADVPQPVKSLCPDYQRWERSMYRKIAAWCHLPLKQGLITKLADNVALIMEMDVLFPNGSKELGAEYDAYRPKVLEMRKLGVGVELTNRNEAYRNFMIWWNKCERHEV